ncbi:hypothetical protein I9W82_003705 [Candida metapsilosis]|uniref:Uncharacterized protein n=1 Tax=Candida metapsilosis TaxID=273372 RepID=A0A8H8DCN3_9ASCO|nr:hypothetical protein I9W82_003705 [Candida metapsilosis]
MDESIQQIQESQINEIQNGSITVSSLEMLKIQLRDDVNRESPVITTNLSDMVNSFNIIIKGDLSTDESSLIPGVYQVLVNLVARSDINRKFFTTASAEIHEFWKLTQSLLHKHDDSLHWLIFTFLGQFIVESQKVGDYMRFLHTEGIHKSIYQHLDTDNDTEALEIAYELIKANADNLDENDNRLIDTIKNKLDNLQLDEDNEYTEKMVEISAYSGPDKKAFEDILTLLSQVEDSALARKMLVAASLLFTNKPTDVPFTQLASHNPYVFAVCCISIGNCIESDITRESTYELVDAKFGVDKLIDTFFKNFKVTDVIQIQAIHMWTNLMNSDVSDKIIKLYQQELLALNQIVIDNSQYYREIAALYSKFLRKLLSHTTADVSIEFIRQINATDGSDHLRVKYILLQKLNFDTKVGYDELLKLIKSTVGQVDQSDVLEQIKTISIMNQNLTSSKIVLDSQTIADDYLHPLEKLLTQMNATQVSTTQDVNSWQVKAYKNNLKYVAATTTKVIELVSNEVCLNDFASLESICGQIITE